MSIKWLFATVFSIMFFSLSAQVEDSVWVVTGKRYLGEGFKNWKPEVIFDGRRTVVLNDAVRLGGLRLGVEHKRVHRWGIGFYGLNNPIVRTELSEVNAKVDTAVFQFGYVSTYYERVLWFHPRWEWSAAIHLGAGTIETSYKLVGQEDYQTLEPLVVRPIELSTSGYFNPTWWASVGGGVGYRYMNETPPEVQRAYNGFIYIVKVKIKFGKIVRRIFNAEVKNEY